MEPKTEVLRRTIEEQNEKITLYQTKLKDLIVAYKDLQKEKSALEASVNALTLKPSQSSASLKLATAVKNEAEDQEENSSQPMISKEDVSEDYEVTKSSKGNSENNSEELISLREQLVTLTQSLATVSQQRSKLEATYIVEKKKLKQDLEDMERKMEETIEERDKKIQNLQSELDGIRNKVRNQQHLHEKESGDYAVMMKELQQLVSTERLNKEQLESQLEDMQAMLIDKETMHMRQCDELQQTIKELKSETSRLQGQLKDNQKHSTEPSAEYLKLQRELIETKESLERSLVVEQQRFSEAEERYNVLSQSSEHRISELEGRLSELSDMLGGVERSRMEDQRVIQRLRERISQLDQENAALTQIADSSRRDPDENLELPVIIEKLQKLATQFHLANSQMDKPYSLIELLNATDPHADGIHAKCKEQYEQLRDDYEKYKLRAQAALRNSKSPSNKDGSCLEKELVTLKQTIAELREKLNSTRTNNEELTNKLRDKEEGFMKAVAALKDSHKATMATLETGHRQKLSDVEMEMRKHRERTVALLAEKDSEISALRLQHQLPPLSLTTRDHTPVSQGVNPPSPSFSPILPEAAGAASATEGNVESSSIVQELLSRHSGDGSASNLLHFAQERGRLDVEIASLRRQKRDLESALRDCQQMAVMRATEWAEQRDQLLEKIDKETRDRSREGANLEYLKNVVYRYMVCTDPSGRTQITKAIATILEFSPAERREVMSSLNKGWWPVTKI